MTPAEVRTLVETELANHLSPSSGSALDLRACLVQPRVVSFRNRSLGLESDQPIPLWIVLEETPGQRHGYRIVFDEQRHEFGLAVWDGEVPVFLGYYGIFVDKLQAM